MVTVLEKGWESHMGDLRNFVLAILEKIEGEIFLKVKFDYLANLL